MTSARNGRATITRGLPRSVGPGSHQGSARESEKACAAAKTQAGPPPVAPLKRLAQQRIRCLVGCLGSVDLLQDLDTAERAWLEQKTTMLTARKGQVMYAPGETAEVLFRLRTGRVQIYQLSPDGQKLLIAQLGPNTMFGEMSLLGQGMYDTFAESLEDATICAMSRRDVEQLVLRQPRLALRILGMMGQRLVEAESLIEDLAFRSVPARLASLLLRLAERQADAVVHLSHRDLAEMASTYRETVTQHLDQFKAAGLVHLERRQIAILDSAGLRRVAEDWGGRWNTALSEKLGLRDRRGHAGAA